MSRYLTTFPGKAGDILWSLPTVRAISQMVGEPVDFCFMPTYKSLLPLLEHQPYIAKAFAPDDWVPIASPNIEQPSRPPDHVESGYQKVWHLGYREMPRRPLIDWIASEAGVTLTPPVLPFLEGDKTTTVPGGKYVACGFNPGFKELKDRFRNAFRPGIPVIETENIPWLDAVSVIRQAVCFVGCRSSNMVIAHGVNQRVLIYEPDFERSGHYRPWWRRIARNIIFPHAQDEKRVFGCPYGQETLWPYQQPPEEVAAEASQLVRNMLGG